MRSPGWMTERFVTANEGDYEGGSRGFTIFSTRGRGAVRIRATCSSIWRMAHGHYPEDRAETRASSRKAPHRRLRRHAADLRRRRARQLRRRVRGRAPAARPRSCSSCRPAVGPEGLLAIPQRDLFVVVERGRQRGGRPARHDRDLCRAAPTTPPYPTSSRTTDPATGAPIGWGALSGLAADPGDPNRSMR